MKKKNPIEVSTRIKELLLDYLFILGYLVVLFAVIAAFYGLVLGRIPEFTSLESQLTSTVTTVIPVIVIFSVLDYKKPQGTWGKRKLRLYVQYKNYTFSSSLIRNLIKFLPWQLAHMGVIDGVYTKFGTLYSRVFSLSGILLAAVLLGMGLFRKDKRHLGDLLAGTQVVKK